jgi:hypothetical protein
MNLDDLAALSRLVAPISPCEFAATTWARTPTVLRRRDRFTDILGVEDFDRLHLYAEADVIAVRQRGGTVERAELHAAGGVPKVTSLYAAWLAGYTLRARFLHRFWPPAQEFCMALQREIHHQVGANAYFSPPHAQGFAVHGDGHDVFVLQVHGRKHWQAWQRPDARAGARTYSDSTVLGTPIVDTWLEPGDALYIPRGAPHVAWSGGDASLHLTLSVLATTLRDLVNEVVAVVADGDATSEDPLALAFGDDEASLEGKLASFVTRLRTPGGLAAALDRMNTVSRSTEQPRPDGHFASLVSLPAVGLDTELVRRGSVSAALELRLDEVALHLGGGSSLRFPAGYREALEFVLAQARLSASQLTRWLRGEPAVELVRALVGAGLLQIA